MRTRAWHWATVAVVALALVSGAPTPAPAGARPGDVTTLAGVGFQDRGTRYFARSGTTLYLTNNSNRCAVFAANLTTGAQSVYAGRPSNCSSQTDTGNGGTALQATFSEVGAIAADAAGNVYVLVGSRRVVRRIDAVTKVVTAYAGDASATSSGTRGDGGAATSAYFSANALAVAPDGALIIGDGSVLRRVDPVSRVIATIAGTTDGAGSEGYVDGSVTNARFRWITGLAFAPDGSLVVVDGGESALRRLSADGSTVTTIAGGNVNGGETTYSDGPVANAGISPSGAVSVGADGTVYFLDNSTRLRTLSADGTTVATVAGDGEYRNSLDAATGPALQSPIGSSNADAIASLANGDVAISGERALLLSGGQVRPLFARENVKAAELAIDPVYSMARIGATLFTSSADGVNEGGAIRRIDPVTGWVSTFLDRRSVGQFVYFMTGDGTYLYALTVVQTLPEGRASFVMMRVDPLTGDARVIAGGGTQDPDVGTAPKDATSVKLGLGYGIAARNGRVYLAEVLSADAVANKALSTPSTGESDLAAPQEAPMTPRIRCVGCAGPGKISTVAGNGTMGWAADGAVATGVSVGFAISVAEAPDGALVFVDAMTNVVRRVDPITRKLSTVAGKKDQFTPSGNGGAATNAQLAGAIAVSFDASGNLFIAEAGAPLLTGSAPAGFEARPGVRRVDASTKKISQVAGGTVACVSDGNGTCTPVSDPPRTNPFSRPWTLEATGSSQYVSDIDAYRAFRIEGRPVPKAPNLTLTMPAAVSARRDSSTTAVVSIANAKVKGRDAGAAMGPARVRIDSTGGLLISAATITTPGWSCTRVTTTAADCVRWSGMVPNATASFSVTVKTPRSTPRNNAAPWRLRARAITNSEASITAAMDRQVAVTVIR